MVPAGVVLFAVLGLVVELVAAAVGSEDLGGLIPWFSLSHEANFPTWFQSAVLLTAAGMLLAIGATKRRRKVPFARHWTVLGYIFFYISVDEFVSIHEQLNLLFPAKGIFYFSWVIPFGILVLVFAVAYLRFLFHLPRRYQILFAVAGVIYVGGALGVELPLAWWTYNHTDDLTYVLIDWVEETLEMVGAAIFVSAVSEIFLEEVRELRIAIVRSR